MPQVLSRGARPDTGRCLQSVDGNFTVGLVQENGGQPVSGTMAQNQAFIVPQGLIHYNANLVSPQPGPACLETRLQALMRDC